MTNEERIEYKLDLLMQAQKTLSNIMLEHHKALIKMHEILSILTKEKQ